VHSRTGAVLRLGGLLVLLGTASAVVVAICLFVGVAALSHSL